MAKKGWTFARLLEVAGSGRDSLRGIDERLVIHVCVDPSCPRALALEVRDALRAERAGGVVEVMSLLGSPSAGAEQPDAAIVLPGDLDAAPVICSYARSGVPVAVVVEGALDAPALDLPDQALALVGVVAASSPEQLPEKLAGWLASSVEKSIALAANFSFCRDAVVSALISQCAVENAAVGAISLIPGSDLPIMCANQAMLALNIAAAYGHGLEPSRAAELAGVLGAGLVWRGAARSLVGLLPGIGMLLKAGVGYGGTLATGNAIRLRFEAALSERAAQAGDSDATATAAVLPTTSRPDDYVTIGG